MQEGEESAELGELLRTKRCDLFRGLVQQADLIDHLIEHL